MLTDPEYILLHQLRYGDHREWHTIVEGSGGLVDDSPDWTKLRDSMRQRGLLVAKPINNRRDGKAAYMYRMSKEAAVRFWFKRAWMRWITEDYGTNVPPRVEDFR